MQTAVVYVVQVSRFHLVEKSNIDLFILMLAHHSNTA